MCRAWDREPPSGVATRCAPGCPTAATSSTGPRTTRRSSATSPSRSSTAAIRTPPPSSTPPAVPPASRTRASCASSTWAPEAGASWIVEESLADAESLATLLAAGRRCPAEEARRIAGEAASALETARQRGLHHLRLTPHAVLRTPDGTVKVTRHRRPPRASPASRTPDDVATPPALDAVGVVALAYAALTSRWPLAAAGPRRRARPPRRRWRRRTLRDRRRRPQRPRRPVPAHPQRRPGPADPRRLRHADRALALRHGPAPPATRPRSCSTPAGRSRWPSSVAPGRRAAMPVVEGAPAVTAAAASASPVTPGAEAAADRTAADPGRVEPTTLIAREDLAPGRPGATTTAARYGDRSGHRGGPDRRPAPRRRRAASRHRAPPAAPAGRPRRRGRPGQGRHLRPGRRRQGHRARLLGPVEPPATRPCSCPRPAGHAADPARGAVESRTSRSTRPRAAAARLHRRSPPPTTSPSSSWPSSRLFVIVALGIGACNVAQPGQRHQPLRGGAPRADGDRDRTRRHRHPDAQRHPVGHRLRRRRRARSRSSRPPASTPRATTRSATAMPPGVFDGDKGTSWTLRGLRHANLRRPEEGRGRPPRPRPATQGDPGRLELGSPNARTSRSTSARTDPRRRHARSGPGTAPPAP